MAYKKQNFTDGQVLTATQLDYMEEGIKGAHDAAPPTCTTKDYSKVLSYGENGCEWIDMPQVDGAVLYTEQTLTAEQQAQARENIDAVSAEDAITANSNGGVKLGGSLWNNPEGENSIAGGDEVYRKYGEDETVPVKPPASDKRYVEAFGENSVAIGMGAVAYARNSKSLGHRTQTGYPSDEEQSKQRPEAITQKDADGNTVYPDDAAGQNAVAIGADTAAVGNHSLAGGHLSFANGDCSLAFGSQNKAEKESVAFGYKSEALSRGNLTSGHTVKAQTNYASVLGFNLVGSDSSNAYGQMVVGRYNNPEGTEKAMFVVGDGNGESTRRNAFVVDRSGNATVRGRLIAGSIDPNTAKTIVKHTDVGGQTGTVGSFLDNPGDYIGQIGVYTDDPIGKATVYIYCGPGPGWVKIAEKN